MSVPSVTFRGGPIPTCPRHRRPLLRCLVSATPDPDQATRYVLSCPDCAQERARGPFLMDRRGVFMGTLPGRDFGTPDIAITRQEWEELPANPAPFVVTPDGQRQPLASMDSQEVR